MSRILPLLPALKDSAERWLVPSSSSSSRRGHVSREDNEGLLEQEKDYTAPSWTDKWRSIHISKTRRYIALGGVAGLILLLLAYTSLSASHPQIEPSETPERNTQTLHLAIPTPDLDSEVCKAILSAEVLHYSTPTFIRWDVDDQDSRTEPQRRMTAVRDYLNKLLERHGNDTVVLTGSATTWFQLRPEVLLKRYYDINRQGNERLAASIGAARVLEESIEQTVVFSASSECGAASVDAIECSQVPGYPLKGKSSHMNAPRYLSQDVVIGRVKDVFEIYRRAVAIAEQRHDIASELAIFSGIFASQERHRNLIRPETPSWSQRFQGWFSSSYSHAPLAGRNSTIRHQPHADEFGIGLDYAGELSLDASKGPESFMFAQHKNLPQDVVTSMPPFWSTTGQGLPLEKTWSDLEMFTNAQTQSTPVMIRTNSTDYPDVRERQWSRFWLRSFARKLFDAYMTVPVMPIASVIDNEGVEQVFWSPTNGEKAGAKDADGKWYNWHDLCKGEDLTAELFGDQLGEWKATKP
ncbi:hypothetical protein MBLNU13_g03264t1 [Cladosporium sp. NU13]